MKKTVKPKKPNKCRKYEAALVEAGIAIEFLIVANSDEDQVVNVFGIPLGVIKRALGVKVEETITFHSDLKGSGTEVSVPELMEQVQQLSKQAKTQ